KTDKAAATSADTGVVEIGRADVQEFTGKASAESSINLGGSNDEDNFKVGKGEILSKDKGKIKLVSGESKNCSVSKMNEGKVDLHGQFSQIEEPNGSAGGITIRPAVIERKEANQEQSQ